MRLVVRAALWLYVAWYAGIVVAAFLPLPETTGLVVAGIIILVGLARRSPMSAPRSVTPDPTQPAVDAGS